MQLYIDEQLASIKTKLQQLLRQYQVLQKENQQLKKELEKAQNASATKKEHVETLQKKVEVMQLSTHGFSEEEKLALQKRIDGYLREIEQCLALLNP